MENNFLESVDIECIKSIAQEAGEAVMHVYEKEFSIAFKDDQSPLTEADTLSNTIICKALQKYFPTLPIMSEENAQIAYENRKVWEYYWCIDPIDGTKEFIKKNGEFTVNIALIYQNIPVLGVVYAPALNEMYWAKKDEGAYKNGERLPLRINHTSAKKMYVVASKSHLSQETQAFIDALPSEVIEQVSKGSSLKLCMVAEGVADIYPRLAPTMEWDTAAADAIVRESGKMTCIYQSISPLEYNKAELINPWFVVR